MKVQYMKFVIKALVYAVLTLAANAAVQTWDMVAQYGMQASNAKPAIDTALADAKTYLAANPNDEVVLYFPAGTWNVVHPSGSGIYINNFSGGKLTLRGESGSQTILVFSEYEQRGVHIRFSDNVTVERMHLTRPRLYTIQGELVALSSFPWDRVAFTQEGFCHCDLCQGFRNCVVYVV